MPTLLVCATAHTLFLPALSPDGGPELRMTRVGVSAACGLSSYEEGKKGTGYGQESVLDNRIPTYAFPLAPRLR